MQERQAHQPEEEEREELRDRGDDGECRPPLDPEHVDYREDDGRRDCERYPSVGEGETHGEARYVERRIGDHYVDDGRGASECVEEVSPPYDEPACVAQRQSRYRVGPARYWEGGPKLRADQCQEGGDE